MKSALCSLLVLALFAGSASAQMTPTRRTTADGRPLASSLPSKQQKRPQFTPIAFDQLNHHIGDRVEVTSIYGQRREGRVEGVSGQTLRLKTSAGIGYAVTNFERGNIRSIVSME